MKSVKFQLYEDDEKIKTYKLTEGEYVVGSSKDVEIRLKDKYIHLIQKYQRATFYNNY